MESWYAGNCFKWWKSENICSGVSSPLSVNVCIDGKLSFTDSCMHGLVYSGRSAKSMDVVRSGAGFAGDEVQMIFEPQPGNHFLRKMWMNLVELKMGLNATRAYSNLGRIQRFRLIKHWSIRKYKACISKSSPYENKSRRGTIRIKYK